MADLSLTEFLLNRITEDEGKAYRGRRHNGGEGAFANDNYGCLLVDPARVLAECEAKRQIVEECQGEVVRAPKSPRAYWLARWTLRILALPYADHPDYREEWRP